MKPKIYWRLNAHKTIGLGHLIRCLAAAKMLKNDFDNCFLIKTDNIENIKLIENNGFEYKRISLNLNLFNELNFIKSNFLTGKEIVVLDGYDFNTFYQKEIKKSTGKLVCIDDIQNGYFVADAIINHSGGIDASNYNCSAETKLFLGPEYLLLRNSFLNKASNQEKRSNSNNIFICFGGEDPENYSLKALKICEIFYPNRHCKLIIGSAYRHSTELNKFIRESELNIEVLENLDEFEVLATIKKCEVAICSASTIALEYLTVGGNLFLIQTAENQKYLFNYLIKSKLAWPISKIGGIKSSEKVDLYANQAKIFDGESPKRILKIFKSLQKEMNISFRLTAKKDVYQYYTWANEAETRKQSFNSKIISISDHVNWFRKKIDCNQTLMIVMQDKKDLLGQVRFDIGTNDATISLSLDKKARGHRLSKTLIMGSVKILKRKYPRIKKVTALVKKSNTPSRKTFSSLGFSEETKNGPKPISIYTYQLKTGTQN